MNLFINRESTTPLHDQIVAQVGHLVASGELAPGQKLPSTRGLARRIGIHHLTVHAAYRALAERGVLEIQPGSGVRVARPASSETDPALSSMAACFVAHARARGHSDAAILAACQKSLQPPRLTRLLVVNPHPDLQEIYRHEIASRVDLPVEGCTPDELATRDLRDTCLLTSTNFATPVYRRVGPDVTLVIFRLAPADALLAEVAALPPDATVAIVSGSPRFVFLMKELLSGARPPETLIGCELDREAEARAVMRLASLVITDTSSRGHLPGNRPLRIHSLLAADLLDELESRLLQSPR